MTVYGGGIRSRYSVDLVDLHTLCEGNYLRLLQIFPDYENSNERRLVAGNEQIVLEVTERNRYTTMLTLTQIGALSSPQGGVRMELRLYHDARMAEVAGFQAHRHLKGRYQYPNPNMYQRDEKHQQNRYVAELLAFCLAEGRIESPVMPLGGSVSDTGFLNGEVTLPVAGTLRVLQITDTHLMAEPGGRLLNVDTDDSLAAVLAQAKQRPGVDALLITGDIAGDASPQAYHRLERALSPLGAPSFWLPGNHDGCDGADVDRRHFSRHITTPHWQICMLNSQLADEVGGQLATAELAALAQAVDMANASGRHLLVASHHPPLEIGCAWLDEQRISNADALFAEVDRCQQAVAVVSGHVHQDSEQIHRGVRYFTSPSTCIQFAPRHEDFKLDDKNPGFRWLDLHPDGSLVTAVERVSGRTFPVDLESGGYI